LWGILLQISFLINLPYAELALNIKSDEIENLLEIDLRKLQTQKPTLTDQQKKDLQKKLIQISRPLYLKYHPDKNPSKEIVANETFKKINDAKEMLANFFGIKL
jgi:hypothetical protein